MDSTKRILLLLLSLTLLSLFSCASMMVHEQNDVDYWDEECVTTDDVTAEYFNKNDEDSDVPPPPTSLKCLLVRKRSMSFHKSADEIDSEDTLAYLADPINPKFGTKSRSFSGSTDFDEWEDFDMECNGIINNVPSFDSNSDSNSNESTPERRNSNDPLCQLREKFATLEKKRSKSFTKSPKKEPNLPSFYENDATDS